MEKYYAQIKNSPIFFGISEEELKEMLQCFNARIKNYENGELIIRQGDMINNITLCLKVMLILKKIHIGEEELL